ncbi:MAG: hypothetical protein M1120_03330 [Patescibacteria group bacterium]|nr:hypothetical protein [Patescibacteria group bacterium]
MKLFFTILFFLFPFGELLKIPVLGRISVLPQEIVIIIGFGLWLIANTKKIRQTV